MAAEQTEQKKEKTAKWRKESLFATFAEALEERKKVFIIWVGTALVLNIIIELLSRRSLLALLKYMVFSPGIFLYNGLIILATLSIIFMFRKRVFVYLLLCALWLAIGITDFIVLFARTTPFTAQDLLLIEYAIRLLPDYIPIFLLIPGILLVLFVVAFIGWLWYAGAACKKKVPYFIAACFSMSCFFIVLVITHIGIENQLLATKFSNIADAYHDYGLPYCFANTLLNTGIERPDDYDDDSIGDILEELYPTGESMEVTEFPTERESVDVSGDAQNPTKETEDETAAPPVSPGPVNVIVVQLESFFDVTALKGITFSEDPIPYYHELMDAYASGYVSVPSIGAGTANTEFEMISGINLDFFGSGEYPYKTILKKKPCESVPYILRDMGYRTHAIHNNDGTFYERNIVFSNLGFDTFTSIEYMMELTYTETGWAEDRVLIPCILDALNETDEQDFVYAISVQGHGAYPEEEILENPEIQIEKMASDMEKYRNAYLYYVNQLREMDTFVKELTEVLSQREEPCVLVLFGDHLPGLEIKEEQLTGQTLFQTPYVIWHNDMVSEMSAEEKDLEAYQLLSHVLDCMDIEEGIINRCHQNFLNAKDGDEEEYLQNLELICFDILYGEQLVYDGVSPYEKTKLQMGVDPVQIKEVTSRENVLFVMGENFTKYSVIYVDGKALDTIYLTDNSLLALDYEAEEVQKVSVAQVGVDHVVLGMTPEYTYFYQENDAEVEIIRPSVSEED